MNSPQLIFSDSTIVNLAIAEVHVDGMPTAVEVTVFKVGSVTVTDEAGVERSYGRMCRDFAWAVDLLLDDGNRATLAISTDQGDVERIAEWGKATFNVPVINTPKAGRA
ncbi:MAG TPA: hypothetical protein VGN93_13360 [Shinella sp.]|jgi:hypothetical protein|uniref:hypothetical protein n=1 Tax=Shinella sp. TaxID=1870904 RepID=UPI002E15A8F1|nr:hypothetical protein [Shinella sp.]